MKKIIIPALLTLVGAGACWYAFLPAINGHSPTFWFFVLLLLCAFGGMTLLASLSAGSSRTIYLNPNMPPHTAASGPGVKLAKITFGIAAALFVFLMLMAVYSAPMLHAKRYAAYGAALISEGDFETDVTVVREGEVPDIAIMDTLTAQTLGSRQIGSLGTLATQYELGAFMTTTINGEITKIAPLGYGSFWKWLNSRKNGMPGYVTVDPVTGASSYAELETPMYYSDTGWFSDNVYRKMRFAYPTALIYDVHFEIDNEGNPYWVAIVDSYKVGLFGCAMPAGVVTCDAVTGECARYGVEEIPDWVSIAYSANDLVRLVNYAGTYTHGFFNSVMAKTDVFQCTDDYGYKVVGENLNAFTGITSAASDQSNIGFVLCDEHTGKIIRYNIYGAEEYSAKTSAEGLVLNYGYTASFPSVCNVEGSPVYIMALTDSGNLIKKYAMVDLQDYTKVTVGDTVKETWQNFVTKYCGVTLNPVEIEDGTATDFERYAVTLEGLAKPPVLAVVGGESYVYLYAADSSQSIYRLAFDGAEDVLFGVQTSVYSLTVTGEVHSGVYEAVLDGVSMPSALSDAETAAPADE